MIEGFINFIVELFHLLKYGKSMNRGKSYEKQLEKADYINDGRQTELWNLANDQYSKILKLGIGQPTYILFKSAGDNWYTIVVVNSEKKFHIRMSTTRIEGIELPKVFYIDATSNGRSLQPHPSAR